MDLTERFRYIMKLNNLTSSGFANHIGVQPSSVSHVLSGRNKPSLEFIQKILKAFPKIDSNWLINGTAQVKEKVVESVQESKPLETKTEQIEEQDFKESQPKSNPVNLNKSIKKIVVFYNDGTFEEYNSTSKV